MSWVEGGLSAFTFLGRLEFKAVGRFPSIFFGYSAMNFEEHLAAVEAQRKSRLERLVETTALWADQLDKRGSSDAVEELGKTLEGL